MPPKTIFKGTCGSLEIGFVMQEMETNGKIEEIYSLETTMGNATVKNKLGEWRIDNTLNNVNQAILDKESCIVTLIKENESRS